MNYILIIIKETLRAISFKPWSVIGSLITVLLAATMAGAVAIMLLNSHVAMDSIKNQIAIDVFLSPEIDSLGRENVRTALAANKYILKVSYVSKDMAMFKMRELFGPEIIRGLGGNPLPESYEISLDPSIYDAAEFQELVDYIKSLPGVDDVGYLPGAFNRLQRIFRIIDILGVSLWILVVISCAYIIGSTIGVMVAQRSSTFYVMRLVGARPIFVRTPYLIVGFLIAIVGFSISMLLLWFGSSYVSKHIVNIVFLGTPEIIYFIIAGGIIGLLGSDISLRRYIQL